MNFDGYEVTLAVGGAMALLAAWLPAYLGRRPLSLPVVLVGVGVVMFLIPVGFPSLDPRDNLSLAERLTELGVIVALMGAGLKIDRPLGWRSWSTTWRMLGIAMPLTIAAVALLGFSILGLTAATAVLLGAVLAPTDPVLASDVQVGEPTLEGDDAPEEEDEVRFTLTSEGGLNDALAFPFVYLAILLAEKGTSPDAWLAEWLAVDVVYRIVAAVVLGVLIGKLIGRVAFRPPGPLTALSSVPQGFIAIAVTLLAYGITEMAQGYGFLAVFVSAITLRSAERGHEFHLLLHRFSEQAETLITVGLLIVFGGAIAGGLLGGLTWQGVLVAVLVILVVRPLAGMVALIGSGRDLSERWAIAFFGVRGIGSLYYLSYATVNAEFSGIDPVWAIVSLTIVISIILHGVTATPVMFLLDLARLGRRHPRHRIV
jgi:sodium/hydrogen antiporter